MAVLAISFMLFITACDSADSQTDLLAKKWVYEEVEVGGQTMSGDMLGSPIMEFRADGTYNMEFGGMEEGGTWKIQNDKLITVGQDVDDEQELTIIELTESKLVVEGEADGATMKVTMVPHES